MSTRYVCSTGTYRATVRLMLLRPFFNPDFLPLLDKLASEAGLRKRPEQLPQRFQAAKG